MMLQLRNKGSPLQLAPKPTHTKKGQHNGAEGPKYGSFIGSSKIITMSKKEMNLRVEFPIPHEIFFLGE